MKKFIIIFVSVLLLDLLYLNWKIFFDKSISDKETISQDKTAESQITLPSLTANQACTQECVTMIQQATAGAKLSAPKTQTITSSTKEFFIPFGSGSVSNTEWQDLSGLEAYVDTGNYGSIKTVTFEASVHVPTGNETANVRLFNVTDQHPVWNSEVFFSGGTTAQLLISQPITLDQGNNLYKVQMKSQLTFLAILDQARIHILTY